jgi:hypothetical protein
LLPIGHWRRKVYELESSLGLRASRPREGVGYAASVREAIQAWLSDLSDDVYEQDARRRRGRPEEAAGSRRRPGGLGASGRLT